MSLREQIPPYIDGNGLVAPQLVPAGSIRGSDNGPLFTAEYFILLRLNGEYQVHDQDLFEQKIRSCCLEPGLLARAPGDHGLEGPDDYYGVLAACSVLGMWKLGGEFLEYGQKHLGIYNPQQPGKWNPEAFLWRQPQLMALTYAAAHKLNLITSVLNAFTAAVIATSCMFAEKSDTDARRLSWLLIQGMKDQSWLCAQAAKVWTKRLLRDYGPSGMKAVYAMYYQHGHPFCEYVPEA